MVHDVKPSNLTLGGQPVAPCDVVNSFAEYFSNKVNSFVSAAKLDNNVYNGKNKLKVCDRNFKKNVT